MKYKILIFLIIFNVILSFNNKPLFCLNENIDLIILKDIFTKDIDQVPSFFDNSFLNIIPAEKIKNLVSSIKLQLGEYKSITKINNEYKLKFSNGSITCKTFNLNNQKLITGFILRNLELTDDNINKILNDVKKIDGLVSINISKNNSDNIFSYNSDIPMAVGSSFKLFILKLLDTQINSGNGSWDKVIKIDENLKSIPSGILQNWPDETPITLKTTANLMISLSDNTATDILLSYLGRETIEKSMTDKNIPFLSTCELFKIKYALSDDLRNNFIEGDLKTKKNILNDLSKIDIKSIKNKTDPTFINELEWFFTTKELCDVIYNLRFNDSISINHGLADKNDWFFIGHKSGFEPGVLQSTHILKKEKNTNYYCISVTINNSKQNIDKNKFDNINLRLINLILKEKLK